MNPGLTHGLEQGEVQRSLLGALNIDFSWQKSIKSQALVDFMVEWT
jgi:hypothetical protein